MTSGPLDGFVSGKIRRLLLPIIESFFRISTNLPKSLKKWFKFRLLQSWQKMVLLYIKRIRKRTANSVDYLAKQAQVTRQHFTFHRQLSRGRYYGRYKRKDDRNSAIESNNWPSERMETKHSKYWSSCKRSYLLEQMTVGVAWRYRTKSVRQKSSPLSLLKMGVGEAGQYMSTRNVLS